MTMGALTSSSRARLSARPFHNDGVRASRTRDSVPVRSNAVAVGDYNNDGTLDAFFTGANIAASLDYDNDGWLDRITAGSGGVVLFHNVGTGRFEDRSRLLPPTVKRDSITQLLIADLDGDGDPDILLGSSTGVHLLRNDGGNAHLGMRVELTALGMGSGKNNSFGIGSKLEVRAGELYQTRVVTAPVTLLGLGVHLKADVLRVQWPNGVPQTIYSALTRTCRDAGARPLRSFIRGWDSFPLPHGHHVAQCARDAGRH
jgi:hypothetical protein